MITQIWSLSFGAVQSANDRGDSTLPRLRWDVSRAANELPHQRAILEINTFYSNYLKKK